MRSKHQQKDRNTKITTVANWSEVSDATLVSESRQEQRDVSGERKGGRVGNKFRRGKKTKQTNN